MNPEKKKIVVAMSGGVDSSVAAAMLAKEGHDVIGVTLRLLPSGGRGFGCCGAPEDMLIAKRSAEAAGVPHYVLDYAADFERDVIDYFIHSYLDGETPNPCLACNQYIKFDKLWKFADSVGASCLATGHYARILKSGDGSETHRLFEAVDPTKDQSYVLYTISQKTLSSALFPVGDKPKTEIRQLAEKLGLPNAHKKDSQEICFVPGRDYRPFLEASLQNRSLKESPTAQPGSIKNLSGEILGEHQGIAFYTIGQRHSLNIPSNKRLYVTGIDATSNTLLVGEDEETLQIELTAVSPRWVSGVKPDAPFEALVKIRYKHEPAPALVTPTTNGFKAAFHDPQRAISPGQAAVIYRWDEKYSAREVIGGGKIRQAGQ